MKKNPTYIYSESIEKFREFGLIRLIKRVLRRNILRWLGIKTQRLLLPIKYGKAAPHPLKIIHIDPNQIDYMIRPNFYHKLNKKYGTFVVDGNWDEKISKIEGGIAVDGHWDSTPHSATDGGLIPVPEYWMFKLARDHIHNDVPLEKLKWGNTSPSERNRKHITTVKELYLNIQSEGYKSQRELNNSGLFLVPPEYDEIRVNIGRDGEFIFDDGRHRFAAVQLLDIDSIPVRVSVRHQRWQKARQQIVNSECIDDLDDWVKNKLNHPDTQDVLEKSDLNINGENTSIT